MYSLNELRQFKKEFNSLSLPYQETTDQNKNILIYIKENEYDKKDFSIVFKFMDCINPNYGHSYYTSTILEIKDYTGLCLNTNPYESLDWEKMDCVKAYIEGFLIFRKNEISSPYKLYKKI